MNRDEEKPIIELLPPLNQRCAMLVRLLRIAFTLIPIIIGVWAWLTVGWLYGLLIWMVGVFASIIILSKLKLAYVPLNQHELSHSTTAILKWYVAKRFCE
jgi:hypothetical protein